MIRITRETDYGILLLTEIARRGERGHSAREAAARVGLTVPMASKILKSLARAGLLHSNRGARGGYSLARPLSQVPVAEVIRALEGPIGLVECAAHPGLCRHETGCPTRVNWNRINDLLRKSLERVAVSELVGPPRALIQLGGGGMRELA
jgi:FeS assembly SUF system regulator